MLLGFNISKSCQMSNWEKPQLTLKQQLYAATDAWVSLALCTRMEEQDAESVSRCTYGYMTE